MWLNRIDETGEQTSSYKNQNENSLRHYQNEPPLAVHDGKLVVPDEQQFFSNNDNLLSPIDVNDF